MKKLHVLLDVLAAAALVGAYEMFRLTGHKLGLVRWLNYNDKKLREAIPVGTVKYIALAIAVVLIVIACVRVFGKASASSALDKVMTVITVALTAYYAYATVHFTYDFSKAAFLIVPLIGLAEYLMIIRCLASRRTVKDSKQ